MWRKPTDAKTNSQASNLPEPAATTPKPIQNTPTNVTAVQQRRSDRAELHAVTDVERFVECPNGQRTKYEHSRERIPRR